MGLVQSLTFHPPDREKTEEIFRDKKEINNYKNFTETKRGNRICMLWFNYNRPITILYSHGNAEDIALSFSALRKLAKKARVNLLAYDYSGYGLSTGRHSEKDTYADIEAAYEWLTEQQCIPPENIIFFGRSLGSGPTTHLATKVPNAGGLILQSPLGSIIRCVLGGFAAVFDFMDIYKNRNKISEIGNYPVLIIHGKKDSVVPFEHGQELYTKLKAAGANVQKLWLDKCGHNDIEFLAETTFFEEIRLFVENIEISLNLNND